MRKHLWKLAVLTAAILALAACRERRPIISAPESDIPKEPGTPSLEAGTDTTYLKYFEPLRLRVDLVLAGNSREQHAYVDRMFKEAAWAGSPNSLINPFDYGQYRFDVMAGDTLIFSNSFSTLFEEWRSTPQAEKLDMSMRQAIWMPFPKQEVKVVLYQRDKKTLEFDEMLEFDIDPADRHIAPASNAYRQTCLQYKGDPAHKVDLVFAGEGYTSSQVSKLRKDARRMMAYLFSMAPYDKRADDFNIWLVESFSEDGGVDIPQDGIWRNTILDSGYDTFYEDRYLTVTDHTRIADVVSGIPFDAVVIIANDEKYGGGGIYNSYALASSDHKLSDPVFIHEFGHSFAGLGDEYFDSSTPYDEEYYPAGIEPWEPNITTQVNFSAKWEDMMGVDGVGLFEGAGYMAKGCWRPYEECRMLNNTAPGFCPVCQRAINRMIDFYVK